MKRKLIALAVIVAMLAVAIVSSTMAYFTDTDSAVNVMTMGNVNIEMTEQQRGASGLEDFTDGKELLPAVYTNGTTAPVKANGFWTNVNNAIDKIITVKNVGKSDAWVRTIVAFEKPMDYIILNKLDELTDTGFEYTAADGSKYAVYSCEYPLAADAEPKNILTEFAMLPTTTQDQANAYGAEYNIIALTQAVQKSGFNTAEDGLKGGFGEFTEANVSAWLNRVIDLDNAVATVSSQAEFTAAVANAKAGDVILLSTGEYDLKNNVKEGVKLLGVGDVKMAHTGTFANNSGTPGPIRMNMTFEDITFTDVIHLREKGVNSTFINVTFESGIRQGIAGNSTFRNCTFYDNVEGYALHLYEAKNATMTLENCTFVEGVVHIGGATNTINFNDCTFSGNKGAYTGTDGYIALWTNANFSGCDFADGVVINQRSSSVTVTCDDSTVTIVK